MKLPSILPKVQSLRAAPKSYSHRSFTTSTEKQATWGFIGLGRMGYPMAHNLRSKIPFTDSLLIHDLNANATTKFASEEKGVEVAPNVRDVAEKSEVIITVLPEPQHVKNVFRQVLSPQLPKLASGERLFLDCSTIDPTSSREVARAVHAMHQGTFIDAPMSGGVVGARAGTLTFLLGAPAELLDRIDSILSMMGKRTIHCGEQGAGLSGKLANNYLLAISNIATAEAMNLGIKWGLDPKVLGALINSSSGRCWSSEVNNPVPEVVEGSPASKGYDGGFGVSLMKKDLLLAIAAATEVGAKLELHEKAREVYETLERDDTFKTKDFSVVYKYLSEAT